MKISDKNQRSKKILLPSLGALSASATAKGVSSIGSIVGFVLNAIHSPDSSVEELRRIIEMDPPFSVKILRRANSAYYGIPREIVSIREAIMYLGFNTVCELALSMKVASVFLSGSGKGAYSRELLWKHSLAVALFSKFLYRREFRMLGDDIYSAALLHDIGIIVEDQFAHEALDNVFATTAEKGISLPAAEREIFSFDHALLGGQMIADWKIPNAISEPVKYHHAPFRAPEIHRKSAAVIFVADFMTRKSGISIEKEPDKEEYEAFGRVLDHLKLSNDAVDIIAEDILEELELLQKRGALFHD